MYLCPVNYIFLECSGIFLTHDSLPLGDPSGDLAALDKKIESLMGRAAGGELQCLVCGKEYKRWREDSSVYSVEPA